MDRAEFADWANRTADHHGYTVRFRSIGEDDPEVGPPTQMAVFARTDVFTRNDSRAKAAS